MTTALNRNTLFKVERLGSGDVIQTTTEPTGEISTETTKLDETRVTVSSDGTRVWSGISSRSAIWNAGSI